MTITIGKAKCAWDMKAPRLRIRTDKGCNLPPYWPLINPRKERVLQVSYRLGAGYIGGWTFFLALNCVSRYNSPDGKRSMWKPRLLQFGFTRNGNRVPYVRH